MSVESAVAENALLAVEVEGLRLKVQKALYERMLVVARETSDLKVLAESMSLTSWAGQPGRQERPGP